MSTSILSIPLPAERKTTAGFWMRLWAALERYSQRRAASELRRIAALYPFSNPALTLERLDAAARAERG